MKKIMVLGTGLQGRAALYDLLWQADVQVVAVDLDVAPVAALLAQWGASNIACVAADARTPAGIIPLLEPGMVVIHLLPPEFRPSLARLAVEHGCHFIDASYSHPDFAALHDLALANNVAILPEFGLDPGIDLVLAARAVATMDEVHELHSYGAGIPTPEAAHNPLHYKISWSWDGVLDSYHRPARLLRDGAVVDVPPDQLFAPENVHHLEVEGVGRLEAYPNGDAIPYLAPLGLAGTVQQAGRYSMRWPGHCAFWYPLVQSGLLGEEPLVVGGQRVVPRQLIHDLLAPQLQDGPDEADRATVRVDVRGVQQGERRRLVYQVIDQRDPVTGFLAMQRTVGYTASIGALMLLNGDITARGLLSPLQDVPAGVLLAELEQRDIYVRQLRLPWPDG